MELASERGISAESCQTAFASDGPAPGSRSHGARHFARGSHVVQYLHDGHARVAITSLRMPLLLRDAPIPAICDTSGSRECEGYQHRRKRRQAHLANELPEFIDSVLHNRCLIRARDILCI
jgi:hypothetical protein